MTIDTSPRQLEHKRSKLRSCRESIDRAIAAHRPALKYLEAARDSVDDELTHLPNTEPLQ